MLQDNRIHFKCYLKSHQNFDLINMTADDARDIIKWSSDRIKKSGRHSYREVNGSKVSKLICSCIDIVFVMCYKRSLFFWNDGFVEDQIEIPVYKCDNCSHYHALLPLFFIVPHEQFSIQFIIRVLIDIYRKKMTVSDAADKYQISERTIYRWKKRYRQYYRIYIHERDSYDMGLLAHAENDMHDLLLRIFRASGNALFESGRTLSQPSRPDS